MSIGMSQAAARWGNADFMGMLIHNAHADFPSSDSIASIMSANFFGDQASSQRAQV